MSFLLVLLVGLIVSYVFGIEGTGSYIGLAVFYVLAKKIMESRIPKKPVGLFPNGIPPPPTLKAEIKFDALAPVQNDPVVSQEPKLVPVTIGTQMLSSSEPQVATHKNTPPSNPPRHARFRWLRLATGLASITGVILIFWIFHRPHRVQLQSYLPPVKVWDPIQCEEANFPTLFDANNMRHLKESKKGRFRISSMRYYCARQWDEKFYAHAEQILDNVGLLMTQLAPFDDYASTYAAYPQTTSNFLKVFDSGELLVVPEDVVKQSTFGFQLGVEVAQREIDMDISSTEPKPYPQAYVVHERQPAIHLVTDQGLRTSLRELINLGTSGVFSEDFLQAKKGVAILTGGLGEDVETNPYALAIAAELAIDLRMSLTQRKALFSRYPSDRNYQLPDLEVIFLENVSELIPTQSLRDREGLYDPGKFRIYVSAHDVNLGGKNVSRHEIAAAISQLVPAALDHEFYHYLFYRPSAAPSGFILEGEATAVGEYLHQQVVTGAALDATQRDDKLRQFYERILHASENGLSQDDLAEFERQAAQRLQSAPFTPIQCEAMELVYAANVTPNVPIPLLKRLTLTPSMLQELPDVQTAYAQSWAVYHVDLVKHKAWGEELNRIVQSINSQQPVSGADLELLRNISDETLSWVKATVEGKKKSCRVPTHQEKSH
jgi:hypothetical protein